VQLYILEHNYTKPLRFNSISTRKLSLQRCFTSFAKNDDTHSDNVGQIFTRFAALSLLSPSRRDISLETRALSFNYHESPFLVFDPRIFSFSRCSLLNFISPFFNASLPPIPAGNGREAVAAVFGRILVVPSRLSQNVDRRREQRIAIFERDSSRDSFFLPPSLSCQSASYHVYRISRR